MTDFAAVQARANASIFRLLATDVAELDYLPVRGKFNQHYGEILGGMGANHSSFGLASELAEKATQYSELRVLNVGGKPCDKRFQVCSVAPDGTGWTVLTLQAVQ